MSDEVLTLKEAAEFLKFTRQTFVKLPVPSHPIPGTTRRRYMKSELLAWVRQCNSTEGKLNLVFRTKSA